MSIKNRIAIYLSGLLLTSTLAACGAPAPTALPNTATVPPTEAIAVSTEVPATIPVEMTAPPSSPTVPASVSFAENVLPILQQNCTNCHGGSKASGGFQINTYQTVMKGSRTGAVILPGDGQSSYLVQLLQKGTMPRRGPKLMDAEIQIIIDWINAGAPNN